MNFSKYLNSLSQEEINKLNQAQLKETIKEHKEFIDAFNKGCCYLCGMKLSYFNQHEECMHWFLLPKGIKKKHFKEFLKEPLGFYRLDSYLRWVANTDGYIKNINDEGAKNKSDKLLENTYKYKDIEWSISCGESDLEGHNSNNSNFPHFHIQIYRNNFPFISYNNFHIPFSNYDLMLFDLLNTEDRVQQLTPFGEGISVLDTDEDLSWLDDHLSTAVDESDATFNTSSIFKMPDGSSISYGELIDIKKKSIEKNISFRKCLQESVPNINIVTEIKPGKGLVKKKKRNRRN